MDERRIIRALQAGRPDEPRYERVRWADVTKPQRRFGAVRMVLSTATTTAAAALLLVVVMVTTSLLETGPADRLALVERDGVLRVAVTSGSPQVVRADGGVEGFDVDVARAIGRDLGLRAVVEAVDPEVLAAGGWGDRWDLAFDSGLVAAEGPPAIRLGTPYLRHAAALLTSDRVDAVTLDDVTGMTLCAVEGGSAAAWMDGALDLVSGTARPVPASISLDLAPDLRTCIERVRQGGADGLVADWELDVEPIPAGLRLLAEAPFEAWVAPAVAGSEEEMRRLLGAVDGSIERLCAEGMLRELSEQRFGGRVLTPIPGACAT